MQIKFIKNDKNKIRVVEVDAAGIEKDFSYVNMMKFIIRERKIEIPEMEGNFSDAEKRSIKSMVYNINAVFDKEENIESTDDLLESVDTSVKGFLDEI